jgi:hypothetical protein
VRGARPSAQTASRPHKCKVVAGRCTGRTGNHTTVLVALMLEHARTHTQVQQVHSSTHLFAVRCPPPAHPRVCLRPAPGSCGCDRLTPAAHQQHASQHQRTRKHLQACINQHHKGYKCQCPCRTCLTAALQSPYAAISAQPAGCNMCALVARAVIAPLAPGQSCLRAPPAGC